MREPLQQNRAAAHGRHQRRLDRLVIAGQVQLGAAGFVEEHLVGVGDLDRPAARLDGDGLPLRRLGHGGAVRYPSTSSAEASGRRGRWRGRLRLGRHGGVVAGGQKEGGVGHAEQGGHEGPLEAVAALAEQGVDREAPGSEGGDDGRDRPDHPDVLPPVAKDEEPLSLVIGARRRRHQPDGGGRRQGTGRPQGEHRPGAELGRRGQAGVDVGRMKTEGVEPSGGPLETALAKHLVVAVDDEHGSDGQAQHQRRDIGRRRGGGSRPCLHSAKLASCRPCHPQAPSPRSRYPLPWRTRLATGIGGATAGLSRRLGRGGGSVVGGRAILAVDPDALRRLAAGRTVALVSGTNGKTTTTTLLRAALTTAGPVASNVLGANLPPGLAAALAAAPPGVAAALEVDEAWLGRVVDATAPRAVALLNLSRDQLDRNNEVRQLAATWRRTFAAQGEAATVVANADDPLVVWGAQARPTSVGSAPGSRGRWTRPGAPAVAAGSVFGHDGALGMRRL